MKLEKVPVMSLFQTPEFRDSTLIKNACKEIGDVWITRDPYPPGHFGTYFGAMGVRDTYDNPYIADLYHLHECTHVSETRYDPEMSFHSWCKRMIRAEFEASMMSECYVYLAIPGLREKTFDHEIWADRFLEDPTIRFMQDAGAFTENPQAIDSIAVRMRAERVRALNVPNYDDFLEHQIWNYCRQNVQWCRIWAGSGNSHAFGDKPAFRVVEEHMSSPDRDANHQEWLDSVSVYDRSADLTIPFYYQAKEFAEVYKHSGALYGNWLLET